MSKRSGRLLLAVLLLVAGALCACTGGGKPAGDQTTDSEEESMEETGLVLFENGEYRCKFYYPALGTTDVSKIRNNLIGSFRNKTGASPAFVRDDTAKSDGSVVEVLLGMTDRAESAAPEGVDEETDAFWAVCVTDNKVVINGSDQIQLSLAVQYFTDAYLSGEATDKLVIPFTEQKLTVKKDFTRPYWQLHEIPAYPIGNNKLSGSVYNCGTTIQNYSAGGNNATSTRMQQIRQTTAEEFDAYLAKLKTFGYQQDFSNTIGNNRYAGLTDGNGRIYVSYIDVGNLVSVFWDPTGIGTEELGYSYTPKDGERTEMYLYGIPMQIYPDQDNGHPNCGMMLVIKCADNSIIVVDGGDGAQQMNDAALEGLDQFLHKITGIASEETIRISAWYMTHYHSDHLFGFYRFLDRYSDRYTLERVVGNLPADEMLSWSGLSWTNKVVKNWTILLKSKYPDVQEIKVHAGQKLQIADVTLNVLFTHENLVDFTSGTFNSGDSNDSSTVIRIESAGMSMLVTGDANSRTESELRREYRGFEDATLGCDLYQMPHHGIYNLPFLIRDAKPTYALFPQTKETAQSSKQLDGSTPCSAILNVAVGVVGEENCFFAGNGTVGFAVVDGKVTVIYQSDVIPGRNS